MRATMLMRHVAKEHSLSLRHHRARALGECNTPDLVLALEPHHATVARHAFPELPAETVRLLGKAPIADPYGRRPIDYRTCADQIVSAIDALEI
jgi:protein-tyrosine-phosphatase